MQNSPAPFSNDDAGAGPSPLTRLAWIVPVSTLGLAGILAGCGRETAPPPEPGPSSVTNAQPTARAEFPLAAPVERREFEPAAAQGAPRDPSEEEIEADEAEPPLWPGQQPIEEIQRDAQAGKAEAQRKLAHHFLGGRGVARDPHQAAYWMQLAAQAGDPQAQVAWANMLASGTGVAANKAQAAHWLRTAAGQGHHNAQFRLGKMLLDGDGIPANAEEGRTFLIQAAENGNKRARLLLRLRGLRGPDDPADSAGR